MHTMAHTGSLATALTHILACLTVGTLSARCTCAWLTAYIASHVNVAPTNRVQNECRTRGSGSKLEKENIKPNSQI